MLDCLSVICALSGAVAVDGDTFRAEMFGRLDTFRLWGIDAPERNTVEGMEAKVELMGLLDDANLSCVGFYKDRYGRYVVKCVSAGYAPIQAANKDGALDLACAMVHAGRAVDWPKYSKGYYAPCTLQ